MEEKVKRCPECEQEAGSNQKCEACAYAAKELINESDPVDHIGDLCYHCGLPYYMHTEACVGNCLLNVIQNA